MKLVSMKLVSTYILAIFPLILLYVVGVFGNEYRLPEDLIPKEYELQLHLDANDLDDASYNFNVTLKIKVVPKKPVWSVVLHKGQNLVIDEVDINGTEAEIGNYDSKTELQTIDISNSLIPKTTYLITFSYKLSIDHNQEGFFRVNYMDDDEILRWLLITNLKPTFARQFFPCFDEPQYKAIFVLVVTINHKSEITNYKHPKSVHRILTNHHLFSDKIINGVKTIEFEPSTVPIPTHLFTVAVSELATGTAELFNSSYDGQNPNKEKFFLTIGRPHLIRENRDLFSQTIGPRVMELMTEKTGIGYTFLQMRLLGLVDFNQLEELIESPGLGIMSEENLFPEDVDYQSTLKFVEMLTQQWFGVLVTPKWWDELWITKGFANFFKYEIASEIKTNIFDGSTIDFKMLLVEKMNDLLAYEISQSEPLNREVTDFKSIISKFDPILHEKAGTIIRMWNGILGDDIFYAGIQDVLSTVREESITANDLLKAWDTVIDESFPDRAFPLKIHDLFPCWYEQGAFPLLVANAENKDNKELSIFISQDKMESPPSTNQLQADLKWNIPITYATNLVYDFDNIQPSLFLLKNQTNIILNVEIDKNYRWYILNIQRLAYLRIDYDDENWGQLLLALEYPDTPIHKYNQVQILSDYVWLAGRGKRNFSEYFFLLSALRTRENYLTLSICLPYIQFLWKQFKDDETVNFEFKKFLIDLLSPFMDISINDDTDSIIAAADILCDINIDLCRQLDESIQPHLEYIYIRNSIQEESVEMYSLDPIRELPPAAKDMYLQAICSNYHLLSDILYSNLFEVNEVAKLLLAASSNGPATAEIAYQYLSNNLQITDVIRPDELAKIYLGLLNNLDVYTITRTGVLQNGEFDEKLEYYGSWRLYLAPTMIDSFKDQRG